MRLSLILFASILLASCQEEKKNDSFELKTNTWIEINYPDAWQPTSDFLKLNDDHSTETMVVDQAIDFGATWKFSEDTLWLNRSRTIDNIQCDVHRAYVIEPDSDSDTLLLVTALFERQFCPGVFGDTTVTVEDFSGHDQHVQSWWYKE